MIFVDVDGNVLTEDGLNLPGCKHQTPLDNQCMTGGYDSRMGRWTDYQCVCGAMVRRVNQRRFEMTSEPGGFVMRVYTVATTCP